MVKTTTNFIRRYLTKKQTLSQRVQNHILFWLLLVIYRVKYFDGSKEGFVYSPEIIISHVLWYLRLVPVYYITAHVFSRARHQLTENRLFVVTALVLIGTMHIFNVTIFYIVEQLYGLSSISKNFLHFGNMYLDPAANNSLKNIWLSIDYDIREIELLVPPLAMKGIKHIFLQEVANSELKQEKLRYKIQVLRSQTAPHFLLNIMTSLIREFQPLSEKAANYMDRLSDILAFSLYHIKTDFIVFKTEWTALTKLLDLEASRFQGRLKVSIQLTSPVPKDKYIPSMVLFTMVENALKHGLYASIQQDCHIELQLEVIGDKLHFICANTIPESIDFKSPKENSGLGLSNITERLELICKDNYSIRSEQTDGIYRVELILPINDSFEERYL